ncbi:MULTISPECIES: ATP-grasp ribosomal peptide maturase [Streptomyces]|uniref:ATP-grasp ribosomal peptide maturase, SAV_5884 family n=1 Tax=Streptomyces harbinensis TaxID=1176198 RepID=A0A1I6UWG0_9ACTN|nr:MULTISPECIES: ATP-grasp ribosomal peptide maturase [Streptomyces]QKV69291.1 ATP-grasp ribosomal peptide maturase [Streptomyces harbinensis]SFT05714.1 ATP-grasp ribosomal peptide maturase, SAV_5884 family [Streptomyces harbinensis]
MTVLVLTRQLVESPADLVVHELNQRGVPVHRIDPGDFPRQVMLSGRIGPEHHDWTGGWRGQHRELALGDVTAVYYRRPSPHEVDPALSDDDARWARSEARAAFTGIVQSMRCRWVNHPRHNVIADSKPRALATAARSGLRIPATLITNDPREARAFVASLPNRTAVYKPIAPPGQRVFNGEKAAVWTSPPLGPDDLTDDIAFTAHTFQQWIPKKHEVRLTVVGGHLFAGEIHAHSDESRIDFRRDYDALTYRVCTVPDDIRCGVQRLMSAFDLRYAALDFLVDHDDTWHLVDVNPNGQYGFIPELAQPIARAIADLLEGRMS